MRRHKKKRGRASKRREKKKKKKTANTPATTGFRLVLEDGSCFEEKRWERFEERERERERERDLKNSRSRFSNGNVFKRERAESVVVVVV